MKECTFSFGARGRRSTVHFRYEDSIRFVSIVILLLRSVFTWTLLGFARCLDMSLAKPHDKH